MTSADRPYERPQAGMPAPQRKWGRHSCLPLFFLMVFTLCAQVTPPRLLHPAPGDWLSYSRTYDGQRHSPLRQINAANVARLRPEWIYQIQDLSAFETSPLVAEGVMYISEPPSNVTALDLRTGRPLWFYKRPVPADLHLCCGQVNRGLAILGTTLYLGTLDAHLLALDSITGRLLWNVTVADYQTGYSMTGAPLVIPGKNGSPDKVIAGIAGGEFGIRGFLDAYDPRTGARLWRFWTVPAPGEKGSETWSGDSWKRGSAPTWVTGSYDPELNLIYWGTGNPGPDYNGEERAGDNLFSASLIAVDADTGALRWHFQFSPHDTHDWDANHVPVLFDAMWQGTRRKLVAVANRNAFYYLLDRITGEFLLGKEYAKQAWADGLDAKGRPIARPNIEPTEPGTVIYPGLHGATNWFSPSYDAALGTLFVTLREEGTIIYKGTPEYRPGFYYSAGGMRGLPGVEPGGSVKALNALTGETRWEFPLHSPPWAGLLSTAGGIVFGGSNEGHLFALDSRTGKPLWRFPTGGAVTANPVTYIDRGRQFVAVAAGHAMFTFALENAATDKHR